MNLLSLADELLTKVRALADPPRALAAARCRVVAEAVAPAPARRAPRWWRSAPRPAGLPPCRRPSSHDCPAAFPERCSWSSTSRRASRRSLADRLAARSALPVHEAEDGEVVAPGVVLIAPPESTSRCGAGEHRPGDARRGAAVDPAPSIRGRADGLDGQRPTATRCSGRGADRDGLGRHGGPGRHQGGGGRTLAESEESCVIYGMPKAAVEAGVVAALGATCSAWPTRSWRRCRIAAPHVILRVLS